MRRGGLPDPPDQLPDLGLGLAPQGVGVGVAARHRQGRRRGAAEINRDGVDRLHLGEAPLNPVERPRVVERRRGGPALAGDVQELLGAGVALVLGEVVAVLGQLPVVAAADHVDRDPAAGELVEGRELPGRHGRRREAGPVGDHQPKPLGDCGDLSGEQQGVRRRGVERHQHPVEPAPFMRLGQQLQVVPVDRRPLRRVDLGGVAGGDEADELDGLRGDQAHDKSPCRGGQMPRTALPAAMRTASASGCARTGRRAGAAPAGAPASGSRFRSCLRRAGPPRSRSR
ncbi:hypothetical protein JHFBIEKO_3615 [Methylobacterium mesophilicum]|nr:hypothetical protein JHFBIEKO_3615 [Methylobacterium mesophilicum]